LLDSSPQVRDAAVELIGKYVNTIPEVADNYYAQIADRIAVSSVAKLSSLSSYASINRILVWRFANVSSSFFGLSIVSLVNMIDALTYAQSWCYV